MIGLRISFELGRYHANPWGAHVNEAATEWPPSPWRLLRGLYSIGRTHAEMEPRRQDLDRALEALAQAPPPQFELPPATAGHTRHFMPVIEGRSEKSAKILDGFMALDPAAELVVWWDADLDAEASDALAAAARRLGHLGRSESVCTAELRTGAGPGEISAAPLEEMDDGSELETIDLLCVSADEPLRALQTGVTEVRKAKLREPPGTRRVTYGVRGSVPHEAPKPERSHRRPNLALFRVHGGSRPAFAEAVAVGQLFRSALQGTYGRLSGGSSSPTLSGRSGDRPRSDQHLHAHYISLPEPDRRIDRLAVWAPEGFGPKEVAALAELRMIVPYDPRHEGTRPLRVALGTLGNTDDLLLPELLGPARRWRSRTPFGLVRHPKVRGGRTVDSPVEQVERELAHRGFPAPRSVTLVRGAWHRFRSSRVGTSRLARATLVGVAVEFEDEVAGPIAIGALSHFGLGLLAPADRE